MGRIKQSELISNSIRKNAIVTRNKTKSSAIAKTNRKTGNVTAILKLGNGLKKEIPQTNKNQSFANMVHKEILYRKMKNTCRICNSDSCSHIIAIKEWEAAHPGEKL